MNSWTNVELTKSPGSFSFELSFKMSFEISNCLLDFQTFFWMFKLSKALVEFSNILLNFLFHSYKLLDVFVWRFCLNFQTFFWTFEFSNVCFEFSNICLNFETHFFFFGSPFFKPLLFHSPCVFNLHSTQTKPMCLWKQGW